MSETLFESILRSSIGCQNIIEYFDQCPYIEDPTHICVYEQKAHDIYVLLKKKASKTEIDAAFDALNKAPFSYSMSRNIFG